MRAVSYAMQSGSMASAKTCWPAYAAADHRDDQVDGAPAAATGAASSAERAGGEDQRRQRSATASLPSRAPTRLHSGITSSAGPTKHGEQHGRRRRPARAARGRRSTARRPASCAMPAAWITKQTSSSAERAVAGGDPRAAPAASARSRRPSRSARRACRRRRRACRRRSARRRTAPIHRWPGMPPPAGVDDERRHRAGDQDRQRQDRDPPGHQPGPLGVAVGHLGRHRHVRAPGRRRTRWRWRGTRPRRRRRRRRRCRTAPANIAANSTASARPPTSRNGRRSPQRGSVGDPAGDRVDQHVPRLRQQHQQPGHAGGDAERVGQIGQQQQARHGPERAGDQRTQRVPGPHAPRQRRMSGVRRGAGSAVVMDADVNHAARGAAPTLRRMNELWRGVGWCGRRPSGDRRGRAAHPRRGRLGRGRGRGRVLACCVAETHLHRDRRRRVRHLLRRGHRRRSPASTSSCSVPGTGRGPVSRPDGRRSRCSSAGCRRSYSIGGASVGGARRAGRLRRGAPALGTAAVGSAVVAPAVALARTGVRAAGGAGADAGLGARRRWPGEGAADLRPERQAAAGRRPAAPPRARDRALDAPRRRRARRSSTPARSAR